MILRPLHNFTSDGVLKGTIVALDDLGSPLGWEEYANWSDGAARRRAVRGLVEVTGITEDQARALITQALIQARQAAGVPAPGAAPQPPPHGRRTIMTSKQFIRDVIDQSWEAILAANGDDPSYFNMGDSLIHLEHPAGGVRPKILRRESLGPCLDRLADYLRVENDQVFPGHPSRVMLEEMLAVLPPDLPVLRRITSTPVLGPDGTCLTAPGYHPDLESYLDLEGLVIPPVPDQPTDDDVTEAKRLLYGELLPNFPFVTQADRANALAPMLTPIVRDHIDGPTPLHMIEAPTEGTGKGVLAEVTSIIITGQYPPMMTEGRSEEEWRKRLTAKLVQLPSVVVIDNVRGRLDSAALSSILTARIWEDRDLGHTRNLRRFVTCVWLATANNPSYSREVGRRLVRERIDAAMPQPWLRTGFHHDLPSWALDNRGRLLWALLVLTRRWWVRGAPRANIEMGSYANYAKVIGGILQEAGVQSFLGNRNDVYEIAAAESNAWEALLAVWWEEYAGQRVGVDQLFNLARERELMVELRAGHRDQGARVLMGRELSRMRDRRIGQWVIRRDGLVHGGGAGYRLEIPPENAHDPQTSSPSSPSSPGALSGGGEDSEDGDNKTAPHPASGDFHTPPQPGQRCTCPDPSDPPLPPAGLPACPDCSSNAFWCGSCGGCRVCIGRVRA